MNFRSGEEGVMLNSRFRKKSGAHMYAIPPRADCYAWLKNDGSPSVGHAFGEAELVIHVDDVAVIFDECAVEVSENLMLQ